MIATKRQQKAVEILVRVINGTDPALGFTSGEMLKRAGYSDWVSKKPKIVTESRGYCELLKKMVPNRLFWSKKPLKTSEII